MFHDRRDAALRLVPELRRYGNLPGALVLAIPRGGLPIGGVLARELNLKLDAILTKKIGHPDNREFAIGAVSLTGQMVDEETVRREGISPRYVDEEITRVRDDMRSRYRRYHPAGRPASVAGKTVILTDDGAATGRTLLVAIDLLRREGAARIVVAIPVAPPDTVELLESRADEVICLETPLMFMAIGEFYVEFSQVSDEEAVDILREADSRVKAK